jgi:hypothetical protein
MYIFPLVDEVKKVVESLRGEYGKFSLALLYNDSLESESGWNLIVSAKWTDQLGRAVTTRVVAKRLHDFLNSHNRKAISRITVLKTSDIFVRQMVGLYPYPTEGPGGGIPITSLTAAYRDGAGFLFYAQKAA